MNKVIEQIIDARQEKGLSTWKVAKSIGVKVDTIQQLESDKGSRLDTLIKMADFLGYEVVIRKKRK